MTEVRGQKNCLILCIQHLYSVIWHLSSENLTPDTRNLKPD
jgi:hypothetical protein